MDPDTALATALVVGTFGCLVGVAVLLRFWRRWRRRELGADRIADRAANDPKGGR